MERQNIYPVRVNNLNDLSAYGITRIAAAIGVFDGIHLGHRKIISELLTMSENLSAVPVVITFFPHPRQVLFPERPLLFLRTPASKAEILGKLGVKAIITVPFTSEFASLSPDCFIENFMHPKDVKLAGICVGSLWRFGAKGRGDSDFLNEYAHKFNFKFKAVTEKGWNDEKISSTEVRKALASGDFDSANYMLGEKYFVCGRITNRDCTTNIHSEILHIKIEFGVLPPRGLYSVYLNRRKTKEVSVRVMSQSNITLNIDKYCHVGSDIEIEFIRNKEMRVIVSGLLFG